MDVVHPKTGPSHARSNSLIEQVVGTFGETIVEEVILAGGYMIEELRAIMGYRDSPFKLTIAENTSRSGQEVRSGTARSTFEDPSCASMGTSSVHWTQRSCSRQ